MRTSIWFSEPFVTLGHVRQQSVLVFILVWAYLFTIEAVISQYCHQEAENETNDDNATEADINWSPVSGSFLKTFDFTSPHVGPHNNIIENYLTKSPVDFFEIFLSDGILSLIVAETNRYANQVINKGLSQKSRVHRWRDTNSEEIKTFFGICLWMGLSRYPRMADYWRKSSLYSNKISEHMHETVSSFFYGCFILAITKHTQPLFAKA